MKNTLLLILIFVFSSCNPSSESKKTEKLKNISNQMASNVVAPIVRFSGETMGTTYSVLISKNLKDEDQDLLRRKIEQTLLDVNKVFSTYIPTSEISKFNNIKTTDSWIEISQSFKEVLSYALNLAKESNGLYDPTVGPLVNLWGFGPSKTSASLPSKREIDEALKVIGFDKVKIRKDGQYIRKTHRDVYLDLSSIAKGKGVDDISKLLFEDDITNFMVEIGGEIRTSGSKNGKAWKIGVEVPIFGKKRAAQEILELSNMSVATSGDYRNFFEKSGKRYSHTINPLTGKTIQKSFASVTVLSEKNCMEADALSTALMAMGKEQAFNYAREKKLNVIFIIRSNDGFEVRKVGSFFNQSP